MAQYLLLIYGEEKVYDDLGDAATKQMHQDHTNFGNEFDAFVAGGNALQKRRPPPRCVRLERGSS